MADETEILDTQTETVDVSTDDNLSQGLMNSFLNDSFKNNEIAPVAPIEAEKSAAVSTETTNTTPEPEEEIIDEKDFWEKGGLKEKFGFESEEAALTEIKSLREKAEKAFEYKNDESKKIAEYINEGKEEELYQYLDSKKKIEKLSTSDLSDKNIAAELVKFGIQKDNPTLNADEVNFLFNKKYAVPKEPNADNFVSDEEYQAALNDWKQIVSDKEREMIIEAKIAQPKIAQLKSELVLAPIQKEVQQQQPSQKDLDDRKQQQDSFKQSVQKTVNEFNGFSYQVKDKDVDYTVSYTPSQEEKTLVDSKLQEFADAGFNANALFYSRWISKDGKSFNEAQMTKDLFKLFGDDKIDQKLVTDAANQRLEHFLLNEKKQIDVNTTRQQGTFVVKEPKTKEDKLIDAWLAV